MDTALVSIDGRMIKMWYTYNGILLSHKKMPYYHLQQHRWS